MSSEESCNPKAKIAFNKLTGRDGTAVDVEGAVALLEECVKEGNDDAEWMLGLCCEYGLGTEQDVERAEVLYIQSHSAGNPVGEFLDQDYVSFKGRGELEAESLPQGIISSSKGGVFKFC